MTVGIGASGVVGVAIETTPGTYAAPTKFFPIRSEGLVWTQDTNWRRVIRGTTDPIGAIAGNGSVEGDIEMELLADVLPYFLKCARGSITKTGTDDPATTTVENAAPFTYEFTPLHNAVPPNTMSITIVRNGVPYGYTGCVVSSQSYGEDNSAATVTFSMLGRAEESVPVPTHAFAGDVPFGAGDWTIEIPTATQVFDADGFSFEVEDNGTVQNRLKSSLGAQFISFGERTVTLSLDRDFEDRVEYDQFKALTSKAIRTLLTDGSGENSVEFRMPVAVIDGYDVSLGGVGDLVRASVSYMGVHDGATGGAYGITVVTNEDVTV